MTERTIDESTILFFEIQSGVTQHPRRPVTRGRFLLGSGDACHMRLGGDDIPPIHSMIVAENGTTVEIERLSTGPALCVNGHEVDAATLKDGDEVSIGRIVFTARFAANVAESAVEQADLLADVELTTAEIEELKQLESLSVVELVDRLGTDMNLVEEHETGIKTGVESLLFEAAAADAADTESGSESEDEMDIDEDSDVQDPADELEDLIDHLNAITAELNERARRLHEREQAHSVAAEELLDQQSRLRAQIELLNRQQSAKNQFRRKSA